jgi:anionic cell wall polymer biosynthesis LytR-Cps2A-Psr (LCP) family protein
VLQSDFGLLVSGFVTQFWSLVSEFWIVHLASMSRRVSPAWFIVVGVVAVVVVAGFYLLGPRPSRAVPTELEPTPTGTVNILIVGKDARAVGPVLNEGRQRNKREEQSHSDIIIICHINFGGRRDMTESSGDSDRVPSRAVPALPSVSLVAIPRDLLVEVPGITAAASNTDFTRMEKIAHVYAIGGDKLLRKTITHLLGIPIHRSIAFDFDTFRMAFDILRPFIGILRIGDVNLTERDQALQFARKRYGLQFDDADRCRNAVSLIRSVMIRAWWLGGTRLGDMVMGRLLAIVGEDTDLTLDEVHQLTDGLRRTGFSPVRTETAVLVAEGADVTLARYNQTLSCYLPAYGEIEKQAARFLMDARDVEALDFMTQEKFRAPGYLFENYVTPTDSTDSLSLPFDTTGMDTQLVSTRLKELGLTGKEKPSAESAAAESARK